jgi:hypothetical protein
MSAPATAKAPFYPPHVTPAPGPLRFPFNLTKMVGNNLGAIPRQAYDEPFVISPGPPRMAFCADPELVKILLIPIPDRFESNPTLANGVWIVATMPSPIQSDLEAVS